MTAEVLVATCTTPCTKSLGCESGGHKRGGDEGRMLASMRHRSKCRVRATQGRLLLVVWTVRAHAANSPPFLGRERAAVDVDVERGDDGLSGAREKRWVL